MTVHHLFPGALDAGSTRAVPPVRLNGGTIHVSGDQVDGFTVSHESSSGDSWGELRGPFATGAEAIADAAKLNGYYGGDCVVAICDAAVSHANPGVGLPSVLGDI